jgi:hypothetical protein
MTHSKTFRYLKAEHLLTLPNSIAASKEILSDDFMIFTLETSIFRLPLMLDKLFAALKL